MESHPQDGHHYRGGDSGKEKTGRPSSCHGMDRTNHPKTKDSTKSVHYDNAFSSLFIVHRKRNFAMGKEKRTRNWATIIYPRMKEGEETTTPDNWCEILEQLAVKAVVSPVHDKDLKEDGEYKKAHRHVVIAFDGVKTEKQAKEIFEKIGGVGAEPVNSLYSMTRYLTHMDNPEKAQYSSLDVLTFGGYEYKRYANTKDDEERQVVSNIGKIFSICAEKCMYDFGEVAEYLLSEEQDLFSTLRKNPYFFATFFKSKQNLIINTLDKVENSI